MKRSPAKLKKGQGLSEYGLVITLAAIAGVGALALFGGSMKDSMAEIINWGSAAPNTAQLTEPPFDAPLPVQAPVTSSPGTGSSPNGTSTVPGGAGTVQATLSNGKTYTFSQLPPDMLTTVATVGANGTAKILAKTLEEAVHQMVASGELTPEQGNLLTQAANVGHSSADIIGLIESTAAKCGTDSACLKNTPITYNGKTYPNAQALTDLVGYTGGTQQSETSGKMWDLFGDATWNMPDSPSKTMLKDLIQEITDVGEMVRFETEKISGSGYTPADLRTQMLNEQSTWLSSNPLQADITAATVAHNDSEKVCGIAGGTDSGTNCKP